MISPICVYLFQPQIKVKWRSGHPKHLADLFQRMLPFIILFVGQLCIPLLQFWVSYTYPGTHDVRTPVYQAPIS